MCGTCIPAASVLTLPSPLACPAACCAVAAHLPQWVDVEEYSRVQPDSIVLTNPNRTLQVLNETYSGEQRESEGWREGGVNLMLPRSS